jgi:hypothetical protein
MPITTDAATVLVTFYTSTKFLAPPGDSYRLSPGCKLIQNYQREEFPIQIPYLNNIGFDLGISTDIITLNTQLTYDHNDKDPWLVIREMLHYVKHHKVPRTTTDSGAACWITIAPPATGTQIDTTGEQYPNDRQWYALCKSIYYEIPTGGGPIDLTMTFSVIQKDTS